jgi:hypothetical protein
MCIPNLYSRLLKGELICTEICVEKLSWGDIGLQVPIDSARETAYYEKKFFKSSLLSPVLDIPYSMLIGIHYVF